MIFQIRFSNVMEFRSSRCPPWVDFFETSTVGPLANLCDLVGGGFDRRILALLHRSWWRRRDPQRSAAIAPAESVQPEHAIDGVQFGWLDELGMHNGDCEQGSFE